MMESAMALATVVQLLGVWRAERRISGDSNGFDSEDLLTWMRHHRFDEIADLIESNREIIEDLRNESGEINSKLDQILEILSGGNVNIDISPEMVEFMNWVKPKTKTVHLQINGSLVAAMVRCIDDKLEGLTILGGLGSRQLFGLKLGSHVPMEVDGDDWPMMKDDLERLSEAGVFECDYDLENDRYIVTRRLEELVESTLRSHLEESE